MPDPTEFAPAERSSSEALSNGSSHFQGTLGSILLDALPIAVIVINATRQVVYCNPVFTTLAEKKNMFEVIGMRPGEALGCVHARESHGGCGTTRFCRHCGAAQAILKCLGGTPNTNECHIRRQTSQGENALDLQVFTSPITFEEETYILFSALDISYEKQLQFMERLFFHDMLNQITAINYTSQSLATIPSPEAKDFGGRLQNITLQLTDELYSHQALMRAERGELAPNLGPVPVSHTLEKMRSLADSHKAARGKTVVIEHIDNDVMVPTDKTLLHRVLSNMLINALEASEESDTVTLQARITDTTVTYRVHNPAVMDTATRARVFKRFVSTKGDGRGLGTYAIKLLGEDILEGMVDFVSEEGQGTTFWISLPRTFPPL